MKWGIGNIKGSGGASNTMLTTTTDATENSGTYTLALSYLSETPKVNDYVAYVNSGAITTLYKVSAIGSTNATLEKIGDIGGGGGSTLYQHNIYMSNTNDRKLNCQITIINDSNVAFNYSTLMDWLDNNGFNYNGSTHNWYKATGHWTNGFISGIDFVETQSQIFCIALSSDGATQTSGALSSTRLEIKDTIIAL